MRRPSGGPAAPPPSFVARLALAAIVAYLAALPLAGSDPPVLSSLTALLVVQVTLLQTLRSSLQRVGSVTIGVLVAALLSEYVGIHWWSLGLVVLVSLLVGRLFRLGDQLLEVAISAMLVLAVGGQESFAATRVFETLVGAAVGVLLNVVLAPRVKVAPAGDAVAGLAAALAAVLRQIARELPDGWTSERADGWLRAARAVDGQVEEAEEALDGAEDGIRLNPRGRGATEATRSIAAAVGALEHSAVLVRGLARALRDRVADPAAGAPPGPEVRERLARSLGLLAKALDSFGDLASRGVEGAAASERPLVAALREARANHAALLESMAVDAHSEPAVWQVHGSLLSQVDRLIHELDPHEGTEAKSVRPDAAVRPVVPLVPHRPRPRP